MSEDSLKAEEERLREEVLRTTLLRKAQKEREFKAESLELESDDKDEHLERLEGVQRRKEAYLSKVAAARAEREGETSMSDHQKRLEDVQRRKEAYLNKVAEAKAEREGRDDGDEADSSLSAKRKNRWDSDSESGGEEGLEQESTAERVTRRKLSPTTSEDIRDGPEMSVEDFLEPKAPSRSRIQDTPPEDATPDVSMKSGGGPRDISPVPMKSEDENLSEASSIPSVSVKLEEVIAGVKVEQSSDDDLKNTGETEDGATVSASSLPAGAVKLEDDEEGSPAKPVKTGLFVPRAAVARSSKKIPDAVLKRKAAEKKQKMKEEEEAKKQKQKEEEEARKREEYEKHMEEQRKKEEENQFEPDDIPYNSDEEDDGKPRPDDYNPLLYGCRSVEHYERLCRIDEGTYGVVFCARNKRTKEIVALKQVKMSRDAAKEGFPITALRETNVLLSLKHPNIVEVKEMVVGSSMDKVYMVMEYMDHDLKAVMDQMKQPFTLAEVKCLFLQILKGVEYMHRCWYIHRDLKTSNLLYSNSGKLTICDFGLARKYESPIRAYTHMVVTLWYRPPELLLGAKKYSTAVDMWGVGCIFAELITRKPLFPGKGEVDQLTKIFEVLGAPNDQRWPGYGELPGAKKLKFKLGPLNKLRNLFPSTTSFGGGAALSNAGFDLMNRLLELDPTKRITAKEAVAHEFWKESPLPAPFSAMPKMRSRNDKYIQKAVTT